MPCKDCSVCEGRDFNAAGIEIAEKEIIPFLKRDVLKLRYPTHPFPLKYDGLLASIFTYGQVLVFHRAHGETGKYYTDNKWLLKYAVELDCKFSELVIRDRAELSNEAVRLACEFNVEGA